jgi:signal transduction histidine kinase
MIKVAAFAQKNSIATQLIKVVFALYCIIALLVTITQIVIEYAHTKTQIKDELAINQKIFESVLGKGLWDFDEDQIQNTINGMLVVPIIVGVKVEQNNTLYKAVGMVLDNDQKLRAFDTDGKESAHKVNTRTEIFSYAFTVNYSFRGQAREVGTAVIYSDATVIMDRVGMGVLLLVINSVIKTLALWGLFFYVGKRILVQPLNNLVDAIENVDFDNIDDFEVDLHTTNENELTKIEHSFSTMLYNLAQAKSDIINLNSNLESIVATRTLDLKIAKENAELANEAKSVFMSRINHELRTPLHAIIGCSQLVENMLNQSQYDKHRTLLSHTVEAGEHLLMLFEDIMDVVVMNQSEIDIPMEEFCVGEVIQNGLHIVQFEAQQKQVTLNTCSTDLLVYANRSRLKQVLLNLFTNGIKYNRPQGSLDVSVDKISDNTISITIADTGVGIAADEFDKIFEPLYRSHYAEKACIDGMGIGLSTVKSLLHKMNATIVVESLIDVGSRFIITLQVTKNQPI